MGRKKKKPMKPWCWYCNREFIDDKVLIQHQRAKHFKCPICRKKLYSGPGLTVHSLQVHKETLDKIPDALPNRNTVTLDIYGMKGVPEEDIIEHERSKRGSDEPEQSSSTVSSSSSSSQRANPSASGSHNDSNNRHNGSKYTTPPPFPPQMFPYGQMAFPPPMIHPPMIGGPPMAMPVLNPPGFPPMLPQPPIGIPPVGLPLPSFPPNFAHMNRPPPMLPPSMLHPPPDLSSMPPPFINPAQLLSCPPPLLPPNISVPPRLLPLPNNYNNNNNNNDNSAGNPSKLDVSEIKLPDEIEKTEPESVNPLPPLSAIPPPDMPSPKEETPEKKSESIDVSRITSQQHHKGDTKNTTTSTTSEESASSKYRPTIVIPSANCTIMHPDCDLSLEELRLTIKKYRKYKTTAK